MSQRVSVLVQTPVHSPLSGPLTYLSPTPIPPGSLVRVPLGQRELLGLVWDDSDTAILETTKLRPVGTRLLDLRPLSASWRTLVSFTASYYQRSVGEVALAALPPQLRDLSPAQLARRLQSRAAPPTAHVVDTETVQLTPEQRTVIARFHNETGPYLLFGATGSGKTEVYLQLVLNTLQNDPQAQALVMVPEINLTPQLEERFRTRFAPLWGEQAVVSLHSGLSPAQRLKNWLAAHQGEARIVLGTRLAIFASLPRLRLIIVDEEHDPSYKQQEGARYSARDLAVYRARLDGAAVLLGSATPSLESWYHSRPANEGGRYVRLEMPSRVGATSTQHGLPAVRRVDMKRQPKRCVFSPPLLDAIARRVARGEQCMVLLNRRGYAPVLHCDACDWKSECPHCSAYRVFHKVDRSLRCHHCGFAERVPAHCPACGNFDIAPLGRGTERLEEQLAHLLTGVRRPGTINAEWPQGKPVRIARIDADSTKLKGALVAQLERVHAGEVDVLVGTQMIAKGHDFRRVTLVAAVNPDGALFSSDFRAPERLFSLLMQAAGRAGRDIGLDTQAEMWIQTEHPAHPVFETLKRNDYAAFAQAQLREREQAGMPPFSYQALVRAEARSQELAQAFLSSARAAISDMPGADAFAEHIHIYPPVPMSVQRVANVERAQMLVESPSRLALQRFLATWQGTLHTTRQGPSGKGLIRWAIDVDPLSI